MKISRKWQPCFLPVTWHFPPAALPCSSYVLSVCPLSAFPPNRLPVDPQSFLSKEVFPLRLIEHVFTNLDDVQIISEILIKAADAYFTIPGAKWNYSVAGRFKQYYFSVLVAFNREMIVDVQVDFIKTREGQQIAEMVALYYLLKYLDQHNIEENTNEAARQMLANFLDRDPDSQTIITANIGEYYDGGQYLYFRAGVPDHMYKFPNLTTLTNGIARGERLHLGKFFDQQITPENLDKDSKQWLDLIIKLSSTADLTRDGYYEASVKNELPLASVIMDEVDQILKTGNTLYNRWKVPIKWEERALKAAVSIKANGADDDPSRYLDVSVDLPADLIRGQAAYYHLDDHTWKIYTEDTLSKPQIIGEEASIKNSLVTQGCIVNGDVEGSVLFNNVYIGEGAKIVDSVLMPGVLVEEGAEVYKSIIDEGVVIKAKAVINKEAKEVQLVSDNAR